MIKHLLFALCLCVSLQSSAEQTMIKTHSHQQTMNAIAEAAQQSQQSVRIAVLLYNNIVVQDFAGSIEVFSKAKKLTQGHYQVFTIGFDKNPIITEQDGLEIVPDYAISKMPEADYLLLPGASMPVINELMQHDGLSAFIKNWNAQQNTKTVSICTGAYLLANTGALDGKKATTHFFVADDFAQLFPAVELVKDTRFVDAGKYITSSGVTSGIDTALYIVGQNSGIPLRNMISRALQYSFRQQENWPEPPAGMAFHRD